MQTHVNKLPTGDHTPGDFRLPVVGKAEKVKRVVRRFVYPIYNQFNHHFLAKQYSVEDFRPDLWLWGQRGSDYLRHRRRVNCILPVKGKDILVAGCGTAGDVESWIGLNPRRLFGVDWFSYEKAWAAWSRRFSDLAPNVEVRFGQADLGRLIEFSDSSIDIISSDAVFEHVKDLPSVLSEFFRILRPGGILYATYGPLWRSWGGDHISGYDHITSGFNHLLLEGDAYRGYLDKKGAFEHSEHDGRTWIEHDLFSRLAPRQYLRFLEDAGFSRRFVSAMIDPRAVACLQHSKFDRNALAHLDPLDLQVWAMTIIYEKK